MKATVLSLPLQQGFLATILERVSLKYFQKKEKEKKEKEDSSEGRGRRQRTVVKIHTSLRFVTIEIIFDKSNQIAAQQTKKYFFDPRKGRWSVLERWVLLKIMVRVSSRVLRQIFASHPRSLPHSLEKNISCVKKMMLQGILV
jgi:hypothetical protein